MNKPLIAIKIDVDTDRGTLIGVPALAKLFQSHGIAASFYFSLGPDNTGRALKRIFRPGFLKKVMRTNVASVYGWRTLLNGVLWPGPHIGKRNSALIKSIATQGFEVGIHCYDHIRWQDGLTTMSADEVSKEFMKARTEFQRIFNTEARGAAAAGWQANAFSLAAYDDAELHYGSDTRGSEPFFPRVDDVIYQTLQIPTTLPTLDELLGREEFPLSSLSDYYQSLLKTDKPNVLTIHAELEGMAYLQWFEQFIQQLKNSGAEFVTLETLAKRCYKQRDSIPVCELQLGSVEGRSGTLAVQIAA